jgi:hypothetical protein
MRLFIFLLIISFGCEHNLTQKETCSVQGFYQLKFKKITCKDALKVSTIEFSNGFSRKLIQGNIKLDKKNHPFSLLLDATTVERHTFPFRSVDSTEFECKIKYTSLKNIEIEWENKEKRVFIRKQLP